MRTVILRVNHEGYACVACQQYHDAGCLTTPRHPDYDAHLYRQDKHGVRRWTETICWRGPADGPLERLPACKVLPAGEY